MYQIHHADCFDWLRECPPRSLQAVCTDPPYGILEFTKKEVEKLRAGQGGVWRLPPTIGGSQRDPLPRFTVLTDAQRLELRRFFHEWGKALWPALVPGAHVCVAGHPILQHLVQGAMAEAGYEVRTAIMRLYFSFRGGDRPKNAEKEFPEVCVTPKGAYEPWMLFRKPIEVPAGARPTAKKPFPIIRVSSRSISCACSCAHCFLSVKVRCSTRSWVQAQPSLPQKRSVMIPLASSWTMNISSWQSEPFPGWQCCIQILPARNFK
jgi:hypothetical protein